MTTYLISRHPGAKEWSARHAAADVHLEELPDLTTISFGDVVCGNLPAHLAAEIVERGARYRHLSLDVPLEARGGHLTVDQMEAYGARLIDLDVRHITAPCDLPEPAASFVSSAKRIWSRLDGLTSRVLALFSAAMVAAVAPGAIGKQVEALLGQPVAFFSVVVGSLFVIGSLVIGITVFRSRPPEPIRALFETNPIASLTKKFPSIERSGSDWNTPSAIVALVGVVIGAALSATGGAAGLVFALWMAIFAGAAGAIANLGRGLFKMEITQVPISTCEPRPVILMFLSHLAEDGKLMKDLDRDETGAFIHRLNASGKMRPHIEALEKLLCATPAPALDELVAKDAFPWRPPFSWQQNIRVLQSQYGTGPGKLSSGKVVVLTSAESHSQYHLFKEALESVADASGVKLDFTEFHDVDPLRLSDMESAIRHIVHKLVDGKPTAGDRKWRYDQIMVDTTAGSKLTSIAGATTTFSSDMVFCYVYDEDVWMLDARASLGQS